MRIGDFGVEVVPIGKGRVRELDSGHVLARPGQVYALRLRNFGPLRCVADVRVDGSLVTAGGLVIDAWTTEELERPISADEDGRFTVIAEGDERVFGPDGGRDNPDLGRIEVRFRRELPGSDRARPLPPALLEPIVNVPHAPAPRRPDRIAPDAFPPGWLAASPEQSPPNGNGAPPAGRRFDAIAPVWAPADEPPLPLSTPDVERAAGTGLTGHSAQRFRATQIGPLEQEATVIELRLVIGAEDAIDAPHRTHETPTPPVRPAARP